MMTISEQVKVFEEENLSDEDMLFLFERYLEDTHKDYFSREQRDEARISFLALKRMILAKMKNNEEA